MDQHNHASGHGHIYDIEDKDLEKNSLLVLILNLSFGILELFGGLFSNSIAIISDSIHDLGDALTIAISYIIIKISKKDRTTEFTYGYKRLTVIGALLNIIILVSGSIFVYFESIRRLIHPQPVDAKIAIILAIFGIVINGYGLFKFFRASNVMTQTLKNHLLEDVLGWVSVLISSIFVLGFGVYRVDSIVALLVATLILFNAFRTLKEVVEILIEKVPKNVSIMEIKKEVESIEQVVDLHNIHISTLDGNNHVITAHLVVDEKLSLTEAIEIKDQIKDRLSKFNGTYITLELEIPSSTINHEKMNF